MSDVTCAGHFSSSKLPLHMWLSGPHLTTHGSSGPPESTSKTVSRSVQPFLHILRQRVPILYNVPPPSPQNCPFALRPGPHQIHGSLTLPQARIKVHARLGHCTTVGPPILTYATCCLLCTQCCIVMVALWNRADHYIFALWFLLSFYLCFFLA